MANPAVERHTQLAGLISKQPRQIIAADGAFKNTDMLKTNLTLQHRDAGIRFTCL
jgi:adenine-specific DNA-methyltransferase